MMAPRFLIAIPKADAREGASGVERVSGPADVLQSRPCLWSNIVDVASHSPAPGVTVVGRMVPKRNRVPPARGPSAESQNSKLAWGTALFDGFWGSYIALRAGNAGSPVQLLRDPSGAMPLYRGECETHHLFGSDIAALAAGGGRTNSVNWDRLYEHLTTPEVRRSQTCLNGISEVAPGGALSLGADGIQEDLLWSPWDYVDNAEGGSDAVEPAQLRDIICQSISAWAVPYQHILVGTSGGLDSSIVCAALASQGHEFTCLTLATADPSGDERRYAAAVAEATGAKLQTFIYDPALIDLRRSSSAHLPRPVGKPFMQELERAYRTAIEPQPDAIFTGNGGDNVFCFLHSAAPIVDRFRAERSFRRAGLTLIDMCRITECDISTMAKAAIRLFCRAPALATPDLRLLNRERTSGPPSRLLTAYLESTPSGQPGKAAHVNLLMKIQNFVEGLDRVAFPWATSPLLCQPIVEACLAVPSWRWVENGINRSFARQAFRDLLPASIAMRVSKAGPDSVMAAVFERGRHLLRDQLLGGLLRRHGLLDAKAVETALEDPETLRSQMFHRLLTLGEAEAWAQSRTQ